MKNNKTMIYLKNVSKKFDKYKKLEASILKKVIWSSISKNAKNYWKITKKTCLSNNQMSYLARKKK